MKRGILLFIAFIFFLLLLIYSYSWNRIYGNVVKNPVGSCKDSDGGIEPYEMGVITQDNQIYYDSCFKNKLREYYCSNNKLRYKSYTCENGCLNGSCISNIYCKEEKKSGLCGISELIFPLNNTQENKELRVYKPGKVLETDNFNIYLSAPEFLITEEDYEFNITVSNKNRGTEIFRYRYYECNYSSVCYDVYGNVDISNIKDAEFITQGKDEFWQANFSSFENKTFVLKLTPANPTLVTNTIDYFYFQYFDSELNNPYNLHFQVWVKPSLNYGGKIPNTKTCGGIIQASKISPPRFVPGGIEYSYGYLDSKCCNNIFYPSFDCCGDNDCDKKYSNGYCLDGKCMLKTKLKNKLVGRKRVLVGYEFSGNSSCEIISLENIDTDFRNDVIKMNEYYNHMSEVLLNKSNYIIFNITKIIRLPSELNGFLNSSRTEEDILFYIASKCKINLKEFEIIILPTSVSQAAETAGLALKIGDGKVMLYQKGNAPTLIHEMGHLFGCFDLYTMMGGHLQWATTLYGAQRSNSLYGFYSYITEGRINEIPEKVFQVCRGELIWTDTNRNGKVDVEE